MDYSIFKRRRDALFEAMGEGTLLVPAALPALRNGDAHYPYRQSSDLLYLTGFAEPECALLLTSVEGKQKSLLFLRDRNAERERWDGARVGVADAPRELGVDEAFAIDELPTRLIEYTANAPKLYYNMGEHCITDSMVTKTLRELRKSGRRGLRAPQFIADPGALIHEMRLHKSADEIAVMRKAVAISAEAHRAAMKRAAAGRYEYELEAEMLRVFRQRGADGPAYESIVGSGPNATVLHYRDNRRAMKDGELVLIDAACEYGNYASDITRTFPVSGKFSVEQRLLYEIVLRAQEAAIAKVHPGATLEEIHDAAVHILVEGLVSVGILKGQVSELIKDKKYTPYYLHRTSHWIGMDVHDVGEYYIDKKPRKLEPGFVLTVEPGLYIDENATDVDARWRGIGIRIEDDVLVATKGCEVLSAELPKHPDAIEQLCV